MRNLRRAAFGVVIGCVAVACGGNADQRKEPGAAAAAGSGAEGAAGSNTVGISTMSVQLGDTTYEYTGCLGMSSVSFGDGGPAILTAYNQAYDPQAPGCVQWPLANPSLDLVVRFRGFLASEGYPTGERSVTDSEHVVVELGVGSQMEVKEGQPQDDYRIYRSDTPGSAGKVTTTYVGKTDPGQNDTYRFDLSNVSLGFSEDGPAARSYPDRVTVPRATIYLLDIEL
jgi:hypothetical protein